MSYTVYPAKVTNEWKKDALTPPCCAEYLPLKLPTKVASEGKLMLRWHPLFEDFAAAIGMVPNSYCPSKCSQLLAFISLPSKNDFASDAKSNIIFAYCRIGNIT
jgi:hypothetical protein